MYTLQIRRQKGPDSRPYWQDFSYDGPARTVAALLEDLNGTLSEPIAWQHSCLVRKCGACAMRIDGRPGLACSTFLRDLKGTTVTLEPLGKFPVVRDLIVDRSCISKSLARWQIWLSEEAHPAHWTFEARYQSSRCLLCGCCLEVCPNYNGSDLFDGAAAAVNAYRILVEERRTTAHHQALRRLYHKQYYRFCGQSLACRDICPARIPVDELLACANQAASGH